MTVLQTARRRKNSCVKCGYDCWPEFVLASPPIDGVDSISKRMSMDDNRSDKVGLTGIMARAGAGGPAVGVEAPLTVGAVDVAGVRAEMELCA